MACSWHGTLCLDKDEAEYAGSIWKPLEFQAILGWGWLGSCMCPVSDHRPNTGSPHGAHNSLGGLTPLEGPMTTLSCLPVLGPQGCENENVPRFVSNFFLLQRTKDVTVSFSLCRGWAQWVRVAVISSTYNHSHVSITKRARGQVSVMERCQLSLF